MGPISDQESTNPSSSASRIAPAATPMKRFRELVYALAFCSIKASVRAAVAFASSVASWLRSTASRSARVRKGVGTSPGANRMISCITSESCPARRPDPAQEALVLGRRHEPRMSGKVDGGISATAFAIA